MDERGRPVSTRVHCAKEKGRRFPGGLFRFKP